RVGAPAERFQRLLGPEQSRPDWVEMNVVTNRAEIATPAAVHNERLVPASQKVSAKLVPDVKALGVNPRKPLHPGNQIGPWSLDHKVKMVAHQTISMDLPIGFQATLIEGAQ